MLFVIILLLFIGFLFIMAESVLPYGISGTVGVLVVGFSAYLVFDKFGPNSGVIYLMVTGTAAGGLFFLMMRLSSRFMTLEPPKPTKKPRRTSTDDSAPTKGTRVDVVSILRPTGTIEFNEHRFPARLISPENVAEVGTQVEICGRDSVYLLVDLIHEEEPAESGSKNDKNESDINHPEASTMRAAPALGMDAENATI